MSVVSLDLAGYTDLPPGKVAMIVTYLEMRAQPLVRRIERPDLALERITDPDPAAYRELFRRIGHDWLWFGRLGADDAELLKLLGEPARELYFCRSQGEAVGLLELNFADPENAELAYFGLVPEAIGSGAGRWLMNQALDKVWARPETKRMWLHTCTADSPQALGFYRSCGFTPYKRAIEVADDPRLSGLLPETAGPNIPVIDS